LDYTKDLNSEQKKAVLKTEGPLLIFAGAGSGKTRVITHRISYLIDYKSILPESICAVTFTNKAAEEMRCRVEDLLSPGIARRVMIRTFHSLCLGILRKEAKYLKFDSGFTVYDTSLQEALIKECMKELTIDTKQIKPTTVANLISRAKDSMISPESYLDEYEKDFFTEKIDQIYRLYEKRKESRQALDFGDLIYRTVRIFRENSRVLKMYSNRWQYLMVDEYQDTNRAQYELVRLLASNHRNLCVVGDDDQSIYSWRGADINNILSFQKDYPDAYVVKLEENYRSTPVILNAAANLIQRNIYRTDKTIFTNNPDGEKISCYCFDNESEEAEAFIQKIIEYKKKFHTQYQDHAIFYRTNAQSRYFEESLRKHSIPYKIFGGFRFFDRKEIKDLIAYLNVIVNPLDSTSLLRIINTPSRGVGEVSIDKLIQISITEGKSVFEILDRFVPGIKKGTHTKLIELKKLLSELHDKEVRGDSPSEICRELIERSGIQQDYESEGLEESISRLENANEFLNSLEDYEKNAEKPSLEEFLNRISLVTSEEEKSEEKDYVVLMTVHNSKGLEFDYVYIAGLEEGIFPHSLSLESLEATEEERRLLYVAITRARKKLTLSHCRFTRRFGHVEQRLPSRFLDEIPRETLEGELEKKESGIRKPSSPPIVAQYKSDTNREGGEFSEFYEGRRVRHRVYGEGKVLSVSGAGENQKVTIKFGNLEKKFLLLYTQLEIID